MTIITFARRGSVATAFGGNALQLRRGVARSKRIYNFGIASFIAGLGGVAVLVIVVLGVYSTILTLEVGQNVSKTQGLEREVELLQLEVMALSSPQIIRERAAALELVHNNASARHVTLTFPKELAVK